MSAAQPLLVVIGSANMDLVVRCEHIARPGETVLGGQFVTVPGGKGANQAVAAARLGADVQFVGCVGKDAYGDALMQGFRADGILTEYVRQTSEAATGVALIVVDAQGQNAITVAPGANHELHIADIDAAKDVIANADAVILQLEIPLEVVAHAIVLAKSVGTRVILNPAPVRHEQPLPDALLQQVDVLTPNEHEAAGLLGHPAPAGLDMSKLARELRAKGVGQVVITLGSEGCLVATEAGHACLSAPPVTAVDTTAAGDCFTGALAVALAEGAELEAAAGFAILAASLSVTRAGAQPSLPTRKEVEHAIASGHMQRNCASKE